MKLLVAALFAFASWAAIAPGALIERLHHATAAALQSPEASAFPPTINNRPAKHLPHCSIVAMLFT